MEVRQIITNKKADVTDILVWLILSFTLVLFFGAWIFGFNRITETLTAIDARVGVNETIGSISQETIGRVNFHQTRGLHVLSFVMILSMALSILITNFLIKAHPVFFLVHIMVTITAIIASVYLSNAYEDLLGSGTLSATLSEFTASSFILLNLPIWTAVIGIFGAVFLFMGIVRDQGAGGSIV